MGTCDRGSFLQFAGAVACTNSPASRHAELLHIGEWYFIPFCIEALCVATLQRYSHQVVDVQKGFVSPTDLEIVIDDVSDLSSFQKSVLIECFALAFRLFF